MTINLNNPPLVPLTTQQITQLKAFELAGQYAEGYRYLRDIANPPNGTGVGVLGAGSLSTWLGKAASINSDDGSFVSNAVRGATKGYGKYNGSPISDQEFQDASDNLAKSVFKDIYDRGGIPPLNDIIQMDVQTVVGELGLKPWQWAGTWGDQLPVPFGGLGKDYQHYPFDDPYQAAYEAARTIWNGSIETARDWWGKALNWRPLVDPLTLDLDGDGIETIGINSDNNVLFDHDGDGARHGTGWVSADDAMLVLDRNSNGTIDSGRELFGDSTIKSNGQFAVDGFDALKDIDSNNDGVVNSSDSQFANLRLWRDLNQDGISQAGELFNLSDYNISSLNVTKTEHTQNLANGNQIADTGTFTKTDGSTGNMADVNLVMDRFNREFANTLDTSSVENLPDMQGSGVLRDLREAATQSSTLVNVLNSYTAATTRSGQLSLLDSLMDAWADTGGMEESIDDRAEDADFTFYYSSGGSLTVPFIVRYQQIGSMQRAYTSGNYGSTGTVGGGAITSDGFAGRDVDNDTLTEAFRQKIAEWTQKLHILESFNGSYFFGIPQSEQTQGATDGITVYSASSAPSTSAGTVIVAAPINISLSQFQINALQKSYEAVKGSIYQSLLLQTRFKPLLDQVNLEIDENGIRLDFTELKNTFVQKMQLDPLAGLIDLIDFNFAAKDLLAGTNWQGWRMMADLLETNTDPTIIEALNFNVASVSGQLLYDNDGTDQDDTIIGSNSSTSNDHLSGGIGDDVLIGLNGTDTLIGGAGYDTLVGGSGNDYMLGYGYPGSVEDTVGNLFIGGKGDDNLNGTSGADTYHFNLGDGKDVIDAVLRVYWNEPNPSGPALDKLVFGEGISVSDVTFSRLLSYNSSSQYDNSLFIRVANSDDQIIIEDWFTGEYKRLQSVEFADGTVVTDFSNLVGTSGNDRIKDDTLLISDDVINGLGGDDHLFAGTGKDTLIGGDGNDYLYGHIASNGHIHGSKMQLTNHIFEGGTGNDRIYGTGGANTYIFNFGDGHDVISTTGDYYNDGGLNENPVDKLVLGEGILPSDVTFSRVSGYYDKDLKINFTNTGDSITLSYWYSSIGQRLQSIEFADGTVWTQTDFNKLVGTSGNDNIVGDTLTVADETINGGDGNDSIYGGTGSDTLIGGAGNDTLYGDIGYNTGADVYTEDVFEGGTGDDRIYGTGGANTFIYNLGDGIDTIFPSSYSPSISNTAMDKLVLGTGILPNDVTFSRSTNSLDKELIINFSNSGDQIRVEHWYSYLGQRLASIEFADGTVWTQTDFNKLVGTSGNDNIVGDTLTVADETINGGAGNDSIYGGTGTDTLIGGSGNDTLYGHTGHSTGADVYTEDVFEGGAGDDTIHGTGGTNIYIYNLGDGVDTIHPSSYSPTISNTAMDKLKLGVGISGSDVTFSRVSSNLVVNFTNLGDQITFTNWYSYLGQRLASIEFADGMVWTQTDFTKLVGTSGNDSISGDTLTVADETVNGGAGNDTISGGTGTDTLIGGSGNDYLYAFNNSSTSKDELTNDILEGGVGNDYLYGTGGANTFIYNLGDGTDVVDTSGYAYSTTTGQAIDKLKLGVGISTSDVTFSRVSSNLVINFTNPGDQITFTNWYYSNTQRLASIEFADGTISSFLGTAGTSGIDYLMGTTGADTMIGGLGNDAYFVDSVSDIVVEDLDSGHDTIYSTVTYTLSSHVENLTLIGSSSINGVGNSLDNQIKGNGGANTLNGGGGVDTLMGGIGNDTYVVDTSTDIIIEKLNEGIDTVQSSVTLALSQNLENLTLTGTNAIDGTGNSLDNTITGNSASNVLIGGDGNDVLNGMAGNDIMEGGQGNDIYHIDSTGDVVVEVENAGIDTVNINISSVNGTYSLGNHFENAILLNSLNFNLNGNALNNYLKGSAYNNILTDNSGGNDIHQGMAGLDTIYDDIGNNLFDGGSSADTLSGGAGNELFIGGAGNDVITTGDGYDIISFNKGNGLDVVNASEGNGNTLSLGGNFTYGDLSLSKSSNDLIVKMGTTDQITFKDWYSNESNKTVLNLQVIAEAMQGFSLGGTDALRNNKVETFSFAGLVAQFDAEGSISNWQLTDARLTDHLLSGSDFLVIGGDLAYQYGRYSSLSGVGLNAATNVIANSNFGVATQNINPSSTWSSESIKLG